MSLSKAKLSREPNQIDKELARELFYKIPLVERGTPILQEMYEAWAGDSLLTADGLTYAWKGIAHQTTPDANDLYWLGKGYNAYFNIQTNKCHGAGGTW